MDAKRTSWLFAALFAVVVGLIVALELDAKSAWHMLAGRPFVNLVFGIGAGIACVGLIAFGILRRFGWLERRSVQHTIVVVLCAACFASGVNYFYGIHGAAARNYLHVHDAYHYFIGPKYYAELDYDDLYECSVATDKRTWNAKTTFRDLSTLERAPLGKRTKKFLKRCKRKFSSERWKEFDADLKELAAINRGSLQSSVGDMGYNGAPFHALFAGAVANGYSKLVAPQYAGFTLLPLFDIAGLCAMLFVVVRAFGMRLGLLAALFFFTTLVDRNAIIGSSFLRYVWLITLVLGVVSLKRARYATAGVWLALSAALNVFPVLFAAAIPLKALWSAVRRRGVSREHKRFMIAGLVAGALCLGLGAAHARHIGNYRSFLRDMSDHSVHSRTPGFGVGLKFDFVLYEKLVDKKGFKLDKQVAFKRTRLPIYATAALLLGFLIALLPKLDDVEATILLGFGLVFCLFGPTSYYYAFSFLLVLAWHARTQSTAVLVFLCGLFLSTAIAYAVVREPDNLFDVLNNWVSLSWTAYFVALLGYLAYATDLFGRRSARATGTPLQSAEAHATTA